MPDLILYRRHSAKCRFLPRGRDYSKCRCPVWCDGRIDGQRVHLSLKTKDWDRAERKMLDFNPETKVLREHLVVGAIDAYLDDCRARSLAGSTVTSYATNLAALAVFCSTNGVRHCERLSLDLVTQFRASLKGRGEQAAKPKTQRKVIENARAFFRFCQKRGWMVMNPAEGLKASRDFGVPTLPFEQAEIDAILAAVAKIDNPNRSSAARARARNRAVLLLMLYSGLRVSDVALLDRSRVDSTGRLMVRMMKTGTPLYVRLPKSVIDALADVPRESKRYFFWSGNGKPTSIIGSIRRSVDCVLKLAGVKGHPHRFRDTFAVRLLEADTPIRTVQLLLGHSSVQTTERHYAPFVHSQQRLLDAATDKLNFGESNGTLLNEGVENRLGNSQGRVLAFPA